MASRIRWSMNHADFCVTPIERDSSYELTPFLAFEINHMATSHLSRPMAESSMMVPTFTENCRLACFSEHSHTLRDLMKPTFWLPQVGQVTGPPCHRSLTISVRQVSGLRK